MSTGTALIDVGMPRLSDSMEEATVLQWLRRPGDAVRKGEPLVEVETDKATMVYEAEHDGVLEEILVDDGGSAALGAVIARLAVEGAGSPPPPPPAPAPAASAAPASPATRVPEPARATRHRATPVARRLAAELGVSLAGIAGSGPGGRIVRADVRGADAGNGAAVPVSGRGESQDLPLTATQRTIAQRMSESRTEIPEFTLEVEIDMDAASRLRDDLRELDRQPLPSFNDLVVRAAALALRAFPGLNASYADGVAHRYSRINIGIAVATDDALLVPTIADADRRSVFELAAESRRLAERVRDRSIAADDLANGTFTISNLGMFGVRRFTAVINHPQAAILAVGEVTARPAVGPDGALVARALMDVSLSCDHRIVYGAEAARFLQRLRHLLEHPVQLIVD